MRTHVALAALCVAIIGTAVPASAQVAEGGLLYVQRPDGSMSLYRRVDRPDEGDGRARFVRAEPADAALVRTSSMQTIPVVDDSAVLSAGETAPTAATTTTVVSEPLPAEEPVSRPFRLRLGATTLGGGTIGDSADDVEGWMAGVALRAGIQLTDWFAIYYQPTAILAGLEAGPGGGDFDEAFTWWNPILLETTLFDFVSIAAGPSMDFYFDCDPSVQSQIACSQEGAFFGLHGRAAVNIGGRMHGHRGGVTLSFELHPTWFEGGSETLAMIGGVGMDLY